MENSNTYTIKIIRYAFKKCHEKDDEVVKKIVRKHAEDDINAEFDTVAFNMFLSKLMNSFGAKEYKCSCTTDPQPTIWKLSLPRHAIFNASPGEIIIHFVINQVKE